MAISVAPVRPDPNLDVPQYALDVEDLLVLARSEKEDIKYREVQLDFTLDIEVFSMLFGRGCRKNRKASIKQHKKYIDFWCKIHLDHPVQDGQGLLHPPRRQRHQLGHHGGPRGVCDAGSQSGQEDKPDFAPEPRHLPGHGQYHQDALSHCRAL